MSSAGETFFVELIVVSLTLVASLIFVGFIFLVHVASEHQRSAEDAFAKRAKTIHLIKTHEGWVYSYNDVRGGILPPFIGSFFSAFAEMMEGKGMEISKPGDRGAGDQFFEDMGWKVRERKARNREADE